MQPPRLADTGWTGLFHPGERGLITQNNWKETQVYINEQVRDRAVFHIDGQLMQLLWAHTMPLPAEYKCLAIKKPSNPFTNVCWVSVLTILLVPQILAASTVFFCPIPETKKWWVMVSFGGYCCRFVLNSKRLLSTSCNKQGQRSSE